MIILIDPLPSRLNQGQWHTEPHTVRQWQSSALSQARIPLKLGQHTIRSPDLVQDQNRTQLLWVEGRRIYGGNGEFQCSLKGWLVLDGIYLYAPVVIPISFKECSIAHCSLLTFRTNFHVSLKDLSFESLNHNLVSSPYCLLAFTQVSMQKTIN